MDVSVVPTFSVALLAVQLGLFAWVYSKIDDDEEKTTRKYVYYSVTQWLFLDIFLCFLCIITYLIFQIFFFEILFWFAFWSLFESLIILGYIVYRFYKAIRKDFEFDAGN